MAECHSGCFPACRRCGFKCVYLQERRMDINPGSQCELCEHCYRADVVQYLKKGETEPVPVPYGWTYACAYHVPPEEESDTRFKFMTTKPVSLNDRRNLEVDTKLVTLGTDLGEEQECINYEPWSLD